MARKVYGGTAGNRAVGFIPYKQRRENSYEQIVCRG